jgi:23S rRNA (adenine2503-C2)-methyltransferase
MTNLPQDLRAWLKRDASEALSSKVLSRHPDSRGDVKLRIALADDRIVECVLLRDSRGKTTACLSTQVGCAMGCRFCRTAKMGFRRNLGSHEIVEQFLHLKRLDRSLSHIVFMGMGEPLLNLPHLRRAVAVLTHPDGSALSPRRITLSTCGILEGISELAREGPPVRLAVSLVTARQRLRETLLPRAAANPLPELKRALEDYQEVTKKRITLEIVLMAEINTAKEDAASLVSFIPPLKAMVNLIPYNPIPDSPFRRPLRKEIVGYRRVLEEAGVRVVQRYGRGAEVGAACGQLSSIQDGPDPPDPGGG